MKSFKDFTSLDEALITFGGKAYPKFGQVVILAGGAGSGGFDASTWAALLSPPAPFMYRASLVNCRPMLSLAARRGG